MVDLSATKFLDLGTSRRLAYRKLSGSDPYLVFLPGFRSDMGGAKAERLWRLAHERGQACLLFDYRGHGASSARFEDGCIGDWAADAIAILDHCAEGKVLLIGSSMGGWIMLLAALARRQKIAGLIGIAPAPDFTERLMKPSFSDDQWRDLEANGQILLASQYGAPTPITRRLLDDGQNHQVMTSPIGLNCPVYLLHGQEDPDVPWQTSIDLAANLTGQGVTIELIKDGDHRLSRESDLKRLEQLVIRMLNGR